MMAPTLREMSCEEVVREVWAHLDGELTPDVAERIQAHLELCDHCRDLYTFEGAFIRAVSRLLNEPADYSALRSRVVEALRERGFELPR